MRRREPPDLPVGRLVVGLQPVREAIRVHGARLSAVWLEDKGSARLAALARFAADQGVSTVEQRPRRDLDRASGSVQHQGAVCFAPELRLLPLGEVLPRPGLLAVALDCVQDPHNFGAVIRSAVAVSRAPVIWAEHASAPLSPATFRASAGAIEHAELCRVPSLTSALTEAASQGIRIVGLAPDAAQGLHELDASLPTILVIGSEQDGMQRSVRRTCSVLARLAQGGGVASLNASVAAGIGLSIIELNRLRTVT